MRKLLLSMLAVTLLLGAAHPCPAQDEAKTVLTVSFSGYDKLLSNINVVGRLGDMADLGKNLEGMLKQMTQGKGLAGLDTKQPWGALVFCDAQQKFSAVGFIPVTDLKQLIDVAKGNPMLADAIQLNGDVYEIRLGGPTLFATQKGPWALISGKKANLAKAPADPLKALGDLPKRYDLAIRASIKNLPKEYRDQWLAQVQAGVETGLQQRPGESDDDYQIRAGVAKQLVQQMAALSNELDGVLLGWSVDPSTNSTFLDFEMTAQTGTKLAAQFGEIKSGKTNFAGLQLPGAAVTAHVTRTLSDADVAQAKSGLAAFRKSVAKELEGQELGAAQAKAASQFLDNVFDVVQKTIEGKKADAGLSLLPDPAALTLVAGGAIGDGAKLDAALKQLIEAMAKNDPDVAAPIKLNAETYEGVRFHTLTLPTPDPNLVPLIGNTLVVVVGVGDDRVLVAAGRDAVKTLKKVIDQSKADAGKEVPPMQITLAATPIAKFLVQVADDMQVKGLAGMAAGLLEKAGGKDHVTLTASPIPQGVRVRLEVEEGLLKVLGSLGKTWLPPMGGTPPAN